ncbi:uncharacterized protein LOC132732991 [Ruditapes philippinarum]|uniref:uncharacterized protein LOC132732991 n=1 Tax=Ruditapes philippinarum TaxID=129788 RepID=UPI00295B6913|nr:uncharacterized protein LOC132732991 [Ruditapes philippinarum]XP_060575529.1 uncharacterized protein LOC132732991 [Ruditapes philippinarum]XP_060575530.1 uncharacterized protein LOC132732991 [Ruditapes philippinarum]XP_060575531.1 uncharacterized protein LOC132732991 [Ruditapes philippinarum]XP_060575532.1 uncharacterized protein LOC132732991 [Ruditapes philippinarum]XP_060575533.1 uncharacterized protein LOC132732991 [Ruditapes philippinarum]
MDSTRTLTHIREEELEYYIEQIERSGRYAVNPITSCTVNPVSTSTPVPPPLDFTRDATHTPIREYNNRHSGAGIHPQMDNICPPARPPPPNPYTLYPPSYLDTSLSVSHSRIPKLPQFSGESRPGDCEFEVWKYDLHCLLRGRLYPDHILHEAIRTSLKGKARTVLLHLGEWATISDVIAELEAIYGNVSTSEHLKEQFYCARQEPNESVAEYSLRLEQILTNANLHLDRYAKNDMLRNRLWSGLRNDELRNVSRYKFESIQDFNVLRRELRQIEQDITARKSVHFSSPAATSAPKPSSSSRNSSSGISCSVKMSVVESKILQQLEEISTQMKKLNTRVETVEKEFASFKRKAEPTAKATTGAQSRWSDRGRYSRSTYTTPSVDDKAKEPDTKSLNEQRPSQKGQ